MNIKFKKVEIHNFMSFADEVINFDDFKGIVKIDGFNYDDRQKNGSGKTSLMLAMIYCLYGQLPKKVKTENIYNRYIENHDTRVCVYLDSNERHFKIVTGIHRGKQTYCELFEISTDGKSETDITKPSINETRTYIIDEVLNCDLNLFMRTVFLNSDPDYNFYNLSSSDKKEFIDKMFNLTVYGDMYAVLHSTNLALTKSIAAKQNQLLILNKSKDEFEKKINEFETSHAAEMRELEIKIENDEKCLETKREKMVKKNTELIDKCKKAIEKISDKIDDISSEISRCDYKTSSLKTEMKHLESSLKEKKSIVKSHVALKSKLCNDCRDVYSKYHNLDRYEKEISDIENVRIVEITKNIDEVLEKKSSLEEQRKEYTVKMNTLSAKLSEHNGNYERDMKTIRELENSLIALKNRLENERNRKNPYIELMENNQKNIKNTEEEMNIAVDEYNYSKFGESLVTQDMLKKFVIRNLVGMLNNSIKGYLHRMGASYDIVFDENMKYDFITDVKDGIEYNNFSKGEQARINIATCFAFRDFISSRSNITSNILILDEFFDSNVDTMALENITSILKDMVKDGDRKIFVVTHRQEVGEDVFDGNIMIEKHNHISKMKIVD